MTKKIFRFLYFNANSSYTDFMLCCKSLLNYTVCQKNLKSMSVLRDLEKLLAKYFFEYYYANIFLETYILCEDTISGGQFSISLKISKIFVWPSVFLLSSLIWFSTWKTQKKHNIINLYTYFFRKIIFYKKDSFFRLKFLWKEWICLRQVASNIFLITVFDRSVYCILEFKAIFLAFIWLGFFI